MWWSNLNKRLFLTDDLIRLVMPQTPHLNIDNSNYSNICILLGNILVLELMQIMEILATHCLNNDFPFIKSWRGGGHNASTFIFELEIPLIAIFVE